MHDFGESSGVPAQARRAETRGDHVHNHACTLYGAQGCKLANGTLFYELCERVPGLFDHMLVSHSIIHIADHTVCAKAVDLLPLVHVSTLSVIEPIKDTTFAAFVHLALGGVP